MVVIKKDGTIEQFDDGKILRAIGLSAERAMHQFTEEEKSKVLDKVHELLEGQDKIDVKVLHNVVESALDYVVPNVAKSYREYRNYKRDFVHIMDDVYKQSQAIMYIGDKENANTDSALVATQRSLTLNALSKELYKKFFLTKNERQAIKEGYIYIHDMSARRYTMNCALFDMATVLKDGFEMGNVWYNEPKTLDTAFDVIGDVILSCAAQQYGVEAVVKLA